MHHQYLSSVWKDLPSLKLNDGSWESKQEDFFKKRTKGMLENFRGCLYIENNNQPKILKVLIEHSFTSLVKLSLQGNSIESIELLLRIKLFSLKLAHLGDNRIVSADSLRKLKTPHLMSVSLRKNSIQQYQGMYEGDFKILQIINIEWYDDKQSGCDSRWLSKLPSLHNQRLKMVGMLAMKRMNLKTVKKTIQGKNKKLGIKNFDRN